MEARASIEKAEHLCAREYKTESGAPRGLDLDLAANTAAPARSPVAIVPVYKTFVKEKLGDLFDSSFVL